MFILAGMSSIAFSDKVMIAFLFFAFTVVLVRVLQKKPLAPESIVVAVAVCLLSVYLVEVIFTGSYLWLHQEGGFAGILGILSAAFCLWPKVLPQPNPGEVIPEEKPRWRNHPIAQVSIAFLMGPLVAFLLALFTIRSHELRSLDGTEKLNLQAYNRILMDNEFGNRQVFEFYLCIGLFAGCIMAFAMILRFPESSSPVPSQSDKKEPTTEEAFGSQE